MYRRDRLDAEPRDRGLRLGHGQCNSRRATSTDPGAGTWWVLIQNWEGSDTQPDTYTLATGGVPAHDLGNAGVDGPDGPVPPASRTTSASHWDIPEMVAGDIWYGTAVLGIVAGDPRTTSGRSR